MSDTGFWRNHDLAVHWCDGAVYLESEGLGLVVNAPSGVERHLESVLARVQAVVLSSGHTRAVSGLVGLFAALEPHRLQALPLAVHVVLGEERGAQLADAWAKAWPARFPITLDAEAPGATFELGPFSIETLSLRSGEPHWRLNEVHAVPAVALRIRAGETTVAWVPATAPGTRVQRALRGANLGIVEVGRNPWPRTPERWRMSFSEALQLAEGIGELWVVGDDGEFGPGAGHAGS